MKKIIYLFIGIFFFCSSQAQNSDNQRLLLNKMADDACIELEKIDLDENKTKNELTTSLGLAILPVFDKYEADIKKVFNLNVNKSDDARTMGEKLGAVLILRCDKMVKITTRLMEDKSFKEVLSTYDNKKAPLSFEGTIEKTEEKEFYYVYFHTTSDEIIKLVLLTSFVNDTEFIELIKERSKTLKVYYTSQQIYSLKDKKFIPLKVITAFDK